MRKVFQSKLLYTFLLVAYTSFLAAQSTSTKVVLRSFPMTSDGKVLVDSKYGDIEFSTWDRDSVRVEITIIVDDEEEDLLERINPSFEFIEDYLEVSSHIEAKKQGYFHRMFRAINPLEFDKTEVDIHYHVKLPVRTQINANNKYGDVIVNECPGAFNAHVEHGDIRISGDIGYSDVYLRFGHLRSRTLKRGEIDVKNGRVDITNAQHLELKSDGTEIEIDSIQTMRISSEKDHIVISSISSCTGDLKFSDIRIEQLTNFIDLKLHQTDLKINNISPGTSTLNLDQNSSDIELQMNKSGIEITASLEGGLLRVPKSVENLDVTYIDKKDDIRNVTAKYGHPPYSQLNIEGKKGYILIKE